MRRPRLLLALALPFAVLTAADQAAAQYTVTLTETPAGVVAAGFGSLDLSTLTDNGSGAIPTYIAPAGSGLVTGVPSVANFEKYYGATHTMPAWGTGGFTFANTSAGSNVGFYNSGPGFYVLVPVGYVSLTPLANTTTFSGTFATLGLTPGTYTQTWDTGKGSFTVQVGPAAVTAPEPSTWALLGAGLLGVGSMARRRRTQA